MKKLFIYIFIMSFVISCGGTVGTDNGNKKPPTSNGNNDEKNPCTNKPVAEDGETPPAIPDC